MVTSSDISDNSIVYCRRLVDGDRPEGWRDQRSVGRRVTVWLLEVSLRLRPGAACGCSAERGGVVDGPPLGRAGRLLRSLR
jgi:hypothetical protein